MTDINPHNWWQPFTNVRDFRDNPRVFTRAEGSFLYTDDNRDVLDIKAGLWQGRQERLFHAPCAESAQCKAQANSLPDLYIVVG